MVNADELVMLQGLLLDLYVFAKDDAVSLKETGEVIDNVLEFKFIVLIRRFTLLRGGESSSSNLTVGGRRVRRCLLDFF